MIFGRLEVPVFVVEVCRTGENQRPLWRKQNPVGLPAAYEKICDAAAIEEFLTLAEGERPEIAESQTIALVDD